MTAHSVWTSTAGWPDDRQDNESKPRRYSRDRLPDKSTQGPHPAESAARLAERARAENWSHEEYLTACLQREVSARESHGGEGRIRAARFPARKSLEEFDFDHAPGLKRDTIAHLGTLDFVSARDNVVFLGPPVPARRIWPSAWRCGPARPATGCVRHRRRMGGTAGRSPPRRAHPTRTHPTGSLPTAGR
jgi:hypothetical protein